MRSLLIVAAMGSLLACGGPGAWKGAVEGQSLTVTNAVFVMRLETVQTIGTGEVHPNSPVIHVLMSDSPQLCSELSGGALSASHTYAHITLVEPSISGSTVVTKPTPGVYRVLDPYNPRDDGTGAGTAIFEFFSKDCGAHVTQKAGTALSGSLYLSHIDVKNGGTADAEIRTTGFGPQQDIVTGSFHAVYCPALSAPAASWNVFGWACH
jgi:hypothetical protein